MAQTAFSAIDRFRQREEEKKQREALQGGTLRSKDELIDVMTLSKEQERIMSHTTIDFSLLVIDYEKTFGKLVFLGYSDYRQKRNEQTGELERTHYRYQVIDETTGVDFLINVPLEKVSNLLEYPAGTPIKLIEPKLEAFAILDTVTNRVNTGFSVTVDSIQVLIEDKQVTVEPVKNDNKSQNNKPQEQNKK